MFTVNLVSFNGQNHEIYPFSIFFINIYIQFQILTRIRIRNLDLWIQIRQKVSDPYGSGSTSLLLSQVFLFFLPEMHLRCCCPTFLQSRYHCLQLVRYLQNS
jgi:hypothetical protein